MGRLTKGRWSSIGGTTILRVGNSNNNNKNKIIIIDNKLHYKTKTNSNNSYDLSLTHTIYIISLLLFKQYGYVDHNYFVVVIVSLLIDDGDCDCF